MGDSQRDELAYFQTFFEHAPVGFYLYRLSDGQLVACNDVAARSFGYDSCNEFLATKSFPSYYVDQEIVTLLIKSLHSDIATPGVDIHFYRRNGTQFLGRCTVFLHDQDILGTVLFDTSVLTQSESAHRHNELYYKELVDQLPQNIFVLDFSGQVLYGNSHCYTSFGYTKKDFLQGINAFNSVIPEDRERMRKNMGSIAAGESISCNEYTILRTDGTTFPALIYSNPIIRNGIPIGVCGLIVDITERKEAEERLNQLAYFDTLTGLPNRTLFRERLAQTLKSMEETPEYIAVMLLDLDRFKEVNDTLGHGMGDLLLQRVAQRLSCCIRPEDLVCRLGGDEFVIILRHISYLSQAEATAQRIITAFRKPFKIGSYEINTTASIGISVAPIDGNDPSALLKNADLAMYAAKSREKGSYTFFSDEMDRRLSERAELTQFLRKAIERDEFIVYFQPIISLASRQTIGVEALVRWQHPIRGLVPPHEFLPLAEELGILDTIDELVLHRSCAQCMRWREAGFPPVRLSVNISPAHLLKPGFVEYVERVLGETGFPAADLELEITENTAMKNPQRTLFVLHTLHDAGVSFALDDFGTGYSSLNHLSTFPIQTVKIDRSFIREAHENHDNITIVSAIIALADALQMNVVAEGVENAQQLALLRNLACDEVQGFLFARPMAPDELMAFLDHSLDLFAAIR